MTESGFTWEEKKWKKIVNNWIVIQNKQMFTLGLLRQKRYDVEWIHHHLYD